MCLDLNHRRCVAAAVLFAATALACAAALPTQQPEQPMSASPFALPTMNPEHRNTRALLENALRYADPAHGLTCPVCGYPYEGFNQDPARGMFLRSFTQLTAIGAWMEVLANVAAGRAVTPFLSRDQALERLTLVVKSLRQDQRDPKLAAKGLLANFLDLSTGKRLGPLAADVEKQQFLDALGREKGEAVWEALQQRGWLLARAGGTRAVILRRDNFGWEGFAGPLTPFKEEELRRKIMAILDQRVVLAVFGDNANLSASVAKTLGALLHPDMKDRPAAVAVRKELEQFLEDQKDGYARLYDAHAGMFYFGWDATKDRLFGWEDDQGKWVTGHMDYLVNEFRGPATFLIVRFGLPVEALANLGFKIKPYRAQDGRELYSLAPWEGSAFQVLGLELATGELTSPSWRKLLENAVEIEVDFATRNKLPGFLSECYTGDGGQYTGSVGIPEITVSPRPRITDAASLYPLGVAYTVSPDSIEGFLATNWPIISTLRTEHGPWEGYNVSRRSPITIQTATHTLTLALGLLGTSSENMARYLEAKGLTGRLTELLRPGDDADLFVDDAQVFAWTDKDRTLRTQRVKANFTVKGERINQFGMAFVSARPQGVNVSGGLFQVRYRNTGPAVPVVIDLKPAVPAPADAGRIPTQLFTQFTDTAGKDADIFIPLPATPGLERIKEVVLTVGPGSGERTVDLALTRLASAPIRPPGAPAPGPITPALRGERR